MAKGTINKVILVGNLGQDPEVTTTATGAKVCTISVATTESWKDKDSGEQQNQTEWHRVVLWRNLADNAGKFLKKGSKVYVEGQLQTREWQDKEGANRKTTEVIAREMQFLDRVSREDADQGSYAVTGEESNETNSTSSKIGEEKLPWDSN